MSGRGRRGGLGGGGNGPDMRRILPVVGVVVLVLVLGFVVLGSCSGSSKADAVPLVRAGRELRGAPVERRRQGARRRALQPGADARPGHHQGRELHPQGAGGRDDGLRAQADGQDQAAGSAALPAAGAAIPHARPAGSRSGAQEGADRQEGRRAGNRDAARGRGQCVRRADRLRRRLRRQLPAPLPGHPRRGERHRRGHRGLGLGALARARQPGSERQRAVDPVGARRRLGQAVHGWHDRHVDRSRHRERQGPRRRHHRHDRQADDPEHVQGHGRQPRQLPGARHRDPPHRGQLEDPADRRSSRSSPARPSRRASRRRATRARSRST